MKSILVYKDGRLEKVTKIYHTENQEPDITRESYEITPNRAYPLLSFPDDNDRIASAVKRILGIQ